MSPADTLEELGVVCRNRGWTLATAESCTGGLLGARITARAGASSFFAGGIICYSNAIKRALLDVPDTLLQRHGAVSPDVALAMARGARQVLGVTVAVAISGIAGPEGGTPEKPVGTVCLAVDSPWHCHAATHHWSGSRARIRSCACHAAIRSLLKVLRHPEAVSTRWPG